MSKATLLKQSKNSVMNKIISKLALSGANFRLEYGLTNTSGKILNRIKRHTIFAQEAGIEVIDTAQATAIVVSLEL